MFEGNFYFLLLEILLQHTGVEGVMVGLSTVQWKSKMELILGELTSSLL